MRPDKSAEGGSFYGMEATKMVGGDLHQQLEGAAGTSYQALTRSDLNFETGGQGTFDDGAVPHDRIESALTDGRPVLFGAGGHQQAIVGMVEGPSGPQYLIQDPMSGSTSAIDPALMGMFPMFNPANLIVPETPQGAGPAASPAVDIPTAASLAPAPATAPQQVSAPPPQPQAPPAGAQAARSPEELGRIAEELQASQGNQDPEKKDPWYKRMWSGLFG
jgi:hypothetical protein